MTARKMVLLFVLISLTGCIDQQESGAGAGPESSPSSPIEDGPTPSAEPEPERIDDGVVAIRPKRVRPGGRMTLAIKDPPGSYGLDWYLHRKAGSEWTYIGGFRAGPPGQWKDHEFNRFYFLPKWSNVGIESIAFDGDDSIDLKVPKLGSGTYRITGVFYTKAGRQWHVDVFEVLEADESLQPNGVPTELTLGRGRRSATYSIETLDPPSHTFIVTLTSQSEPNLRLWLMASDDTRLEITSSTWDDPSCASGDKTTRCEWHFPTLEARTAGAWELNVMKESAPKVEVTITVNFEPTS